jgi:type VI protein secretion system component VasK
LAEGAAGSRERKSLQWPGEGPGSAVGKFEEQFIPQLAFSEAGPWALFRTIDRYATAPPDASGRLTFEVKNLYHSVEVVLEPPSARTSLFGKDWRQFTCEVS